jgi:hypothetical protein
VIEDLNVNGMAQNKKLARQISDCAWGAFREFLTYKVEWYGKNLKVIGRFEPSSKMCSECGEKNNELKLSDRTWDCKSCGVKHDRDFNAAKNIRDIGLKVAGGAANCELTCGISQSVSQKISHESVGTSTDGRGFLKNNKMSDYKGIFAADDFGLGSDTPNFGIYQVNVVKRSDTNEVVWSGEVEATSTKKAQQKWRKEYADVRARYDHSFALTIKRISSL